MRPTLADYLLEINPKSTHARAAIEPSSEPIGDTDAEFIETTVSPEEEIAARIALACDAARAEERAKGEAALEQALAAARNAYDAALVTARADWTRDEGARLAALIAEGLVGIEQRIAADAARVLAPVLDAAMRERAVSALCETVATLLRADPAARLAMRGPEDLGRAVLARLGAAAASVTFVPESGADLAVEFKDTLLETQLAAWAERLRAEAA